MKDEKKISSNRQKKEKIIAEIQEKVEKAKAMVFTNYQGMTHQQIEGLKKELKTLQADLVVTKNTLLNRALGTIGHKLDEVSAENPTATLFAYNDTVTPLKALTKLIKALKLPVIKSGIFEGRVLSENEIMKLSTLPSRPVLLGQLVGTMKSPIFGLHRALSWNMQKFVLTLSAIEKSKKA